MRYLLLASFLLCHCQQPRVESASPVERSTFEPLPWFDAESRLNRISQRHFSGSFVIWQMPLNEEAMTAIELATGRERNIVHEWSEAILAQDPAQTLDSLKTLQGTVSERRRELSLALENSRMQLAQEWTAGWLNDLPEPERASGQLRWQLYCEAKLWERALDGNFVGASYRRRPTPAAVCEGAYRQLGYFRDADGHETERCTTSEAGKNYFACLWQDGVMRTTLMAARYPAESEAGEILRRITNEQWMQNILWNNRLGSQILKHQKVSFYSDEQRLEEHEIAELPRLSRVEIPEFGTTSVYMIAYGIENQREILATSVGGEVYESLQVLNTSGAFASVSEALFNAPYGIDLSYEQANADPSFWQKAQQTWPDMFSGRAEREQAALSAAEESFAAEQKAAREWVDQIEPERGCEPGEDTLGCRRAQIMQDKLALTASSDVTVARFVNAGLTIGQDFNTDELWLEWQWNKREAGSVRSCQTKGESCIVPLAVSELGFLNITLDQQQLRDTGIATLPRNNNNSLEYNEIPLEDIETWNLNLALNRYPDTAAEGHLPFVALEWQLKDAEGQVQYVGHGMLIDDEFLHRPSFKQLADFVRSQE